MKRLVYSSRKAVLVVTALFVHAAMCWAEGQPQKLQSAGDGVTIHITYYSPAADKAPNGKQESPVVVLLHGAGGNRLDWDKRTTLPKELEDKGYAVITVDLRKHGESLIGGKKESPVPADYEKMVLGDLVAVKQFILQEHLNKQLNMNKMAIVASDFTVPIALKFAELDWRQAPYDDSAIPANRTPRGQDVKVIVGISPEPNAGTVRASSAVNFFKAPIVQIALLLIVGEEDLESKKEAETLSKVFASGRGNAEHSLLTQVPQLKDHGMPLVIKDQRRMNPHIIAFLDKQLATLGRPWEDRRSRLER